MILQQQAPLLEYLHPKLFTTELRNPLNLISIVLLQSEVIQEGVTGVEVFLARNVVKDVGVEAKDTLYEDQKEEVLPDTHPISDLRVVGKLHLFRDAWCQSATFHMVSKYLR